MRDSLRSQEQEVTVVHDPWGPVKLDERTFEAWRPLRRQQDGYDRPASERNDEDEAE